VITDYYYQPQPSSNNKRVSTDMAFLPLTANSLAAANFHLRNTLGGKQPALNLHE
jgi:hypothetical protein